MNNLTLISAVIITFNEEKNIERCLKSLIPIADEIIVIDSFSTDRTEEICGKYDVKFVSQEWLGYAKSKNLGNQLATHSYILSVDADEAVSDDLANTLILLKRKKVTGAFELKRLTNYCGYWVNHCGWYPDAKVRLFPKLRAQWVGDSVHEQLQLAKELQVTRLNGDLLHYSYYTTKQHMQTIDKYTTLGADDLHQRNKKTSQTMAHIKAVVRFVRMYVFQSGWLDGWAGWMICKNSAYGVWLKYHKLNLLNNPAKKIS